MANRRTPQHRGRFGFPNGNGNGRFPGGGFPQPPPPPPPPSKPTSTPKPPPQHTTTKPAAPPPAKHTPTSKAPAPTSRQPNPPPASRPAQPTSTPPAPNPPPPSSTTSLPLDTLTGPAGQIAAVHPSSTTKATGKGASHTTKTSKSTGTGKSTPAHKGSSSAIVAVVAVIVVLVALAGIGYAVRRWMLNRRKAQTKRWSQSLQTKLENRRRSLGASDQGSVAPLRPPMTEKPLAPLPPEAALDVPATPGGPDQSRPQSAYSSASGPSAQHAPLLAVFPPPPSPGSPYLPSPALTTPNLRDIRIVKRTFVPTLQDELPVTMGETIYVLQAFDDGWAQCSNTRGEQGVVPLECLGQENETFADQQQQHLNDQEDGGWRLSKRASSMYSVAGAPGTN